MSNLYEPVSENNEPASRFDEVESDNVLDQLKAVVGKKVMRPEIFISVPERPGVQLLISPNITQQQLRAWQKNAGSETKNGIDATKFACQVIGHTTVGIYLNGEEVYEDGKSLGFASPSVLKMTNSTRALPDAVIAFFGLDPHVEAAALAIIDAAGYGDTVEQTENPTKLS
ncbi:MAG: hypothetical protein EB103_02585 [Actinobacteria bacterium]|jgi:hypothetical protein|nr:hypothetical protein [Actinomycetota bacterium]